MTELRFVSAEEAAKWPEDCGEVLMLRDLPGGGVGAHLAIWSAIYSRPPYSWSHFARLPESLPEVELTDQRPEAAS